MCLALLKDDPSYQVYFRRKHPSSNVNCLEMDEYSLIIGVSRAIQIAEEKQQEKVLPFSSAFTLPYPLLDYYLKKVYSCWCVVTHLIEKMFFLNLEIVEFGFVDCG